MSKDIPVCEICGQTTEWMSTVNDLFKSVNWETGYWDYRLAKSHTFCSKHDRQGEFINVTSAPWGME